MLMQSLLKEKMGVSMLGESLCINRFHTKPILPFIRKYNLKCKACHVIHTRNVVLSQIENVFLPNLNRLS